MSERTAAAGQQPRTVDNFMAYQQALTAQKLGGANIVLGHAAGEQREGDIVPAAAEVTKLKKQQEDLQAFQDSLKGKSPADQEAMIKNSAYAKQWEQYKNQPLSSDSPVSPTAAAALPDGNIAAPSNKPTAAFNSAASPDAAIPQAAAPKVEIQTADATLDNKLKPLSPAA